MKLQTAFRIFRPVLIALLLVSCVTAAELMPSPTPPASLRPFSSDGCSMFPDRALIGNSDWCDCCLAHDLAYWRGGTEEARLAADQKLQTCVQNATGNKVLADMMFTGVRTGGGPYYFTPYRWGYGWSYGRGYKALDEKEQAQVTQMEQAYQGSGKPAACVRQSPS